MASPDIDLAVGRVEVDAVDGEEKSGKVANAM